MWKKSPSSGYPPVNSFAFASVFPAELHFPGRDKRMRNILRIAAPAALLAGSLFGGGFYLQL
jgi:hypothetical protein